MNLRQQSFVFLIVSNSAGDVTSPLCHHFHHGDGAQYNASVPPILILKKMRMPVRCKAIPDREPYKYYKKFKANLNM